ncbi:MAG: hypothetical protein RJA70_1996 [Pseudomonadota bacterium]|jgi:hypothetical protein
MSSSLERDSAETTIINYESDAIIEIVIDCLQYRVDAGKQGTALCVSTRLKGGWDWEYAAEVRFDGRDVRSKTLDREVRAQLGKALQLALREQAEL